MFGLFGYVYPEPVLSDGTIEDKVNAFFAVDNDLAEDADVEFEEETIE